MKKVLLAVDDTKGTLKALDMFMDLFNNKTPVEVVLLYTEKIEGHSLMDDVLLSESEMKTLKESIQGTEYKEMLDRRAEKIIRFYQEKIENHGIKKIKALVKEGHPAEEILAAAKEEGVGLIIMGSRGRRLKDLFVGSVSREVANKSDISVLLAK